MDEHAYVVNVDVAVVDDGNYLLIRRGQDKDHAPGQLAFPGGRVEQPPGRTNSIEHTAKRELEEEVGLKANAVEYVTSSTFADDRGQRCLNVVTACESFAGEPSVMAGDELSSVQWMSVETLRSHDEVPPFLERYVEEVESHLSE